MNNRITAIIVGLALALGCYLALTDDVGKTMAPCGEPGIP